MALTPPPPPEADAQDGEFTFLQAIAAGWTPWQLEVAQRSGHLVPLAHGVYVLAVRLVGITDRDRHLLDVRAKQLSYAAGWYAGRRSGAVVHDLPIIGTAPKIPQLVRDPEGTRSKGHSRHEQVAALPPEHRVEVDGILVCSLPRNTVDIARREVFRNGVVAADAALRRGVTKDELRAVARSQRRWPGVARAREVIEFADGRSETPGESVTRVAFRRENIEIPEPQVEVWRWGRFIARLDFLFRRALLAVEFDGALKFTGAGVLPALLGRAEEIRDCGIAVLHTNWNETYSRTEAFGMRVKQRLQEPARQLSDGVELRSTTVPVPGVGRPAAA